MKKKVNKHLGFTGERIATRILADAVLNQDPSRNGLIVSVDNLVEQYITRNGLTVSVDDFVKQYAMVCNIDATGCNVDHLEKVVKVRQYLVHHIRQYALANRPHCLRKYVDIL